MAYQPQRRPPVAPERAPVPPSLDDQRDAVCIDAGLAAMVGVMKDMIAAQPRRELKTLQPDEGRRMVQAAVAGFIVKRAEQARALSDPVNDIFATPSLSSTGAGVAENSLIGTLLA